MWNISSRIVCERVLCVWKNCVPLSCVRWQPNSQRHQSWCPYCWIWSTQKKKEEPKKNVASQTSWCFFRGRRQGRQPLNNLVGLNDSPTRRYLVLNEVGILANRTGDRSYRAIFRAASFGDVNSIKWLPFWTGWWLTYPSENGVRQLGWWHSQ